MGRIAAAGLLLLLTLQGSGCSGPGLRSFDKALLGYDLSRSPQFAAAKFAAPDADVRTDAVDGNPTWLALGASLAMSAETRPSAEIGDEAPATRPAEEEAFVFWRRRRGPAYQGDFWRSLGRDAKELPLVLWDDTKATVTNPVSLAFLGAAGATGIVLSGGNGNDQVQRHYEKHGSGLNTEWDSVGGFFGSPAFHFPLAGVMYVTTLAAGDTRNYEVSKTLISALALNGLTTMTLKVAARTESPNGDEFGWPSGHAASTFTLATVMYEEYGPLLGVPLFGFAAFVGYERIDARNHDFSDVISGALIGIAIGHAVAKNHQARLLGMEVIPYADPQRGTVGLAFSKRW